MKNNRHKVYLTSSTFKSIIYIFIDLFIILIAYIFGALAQNGTLEVELFYFILGVALFKIIIYLIFWN